MTEEPTEVVLTSGSALTFAADGMLDAYDIAKENGDVDSMIKISALWLKMAGMLEDTLPDEPGNDEGTGHYL